MEHSVSNHLGIHKEMHKTAEDLLPEDNELFSEQTDIALLLSRHSNVASS